MPQMRDLIKSFVRFSKKRVGETGDKNTTAGTSQHSFQQGNIALKSCGDFSDWD
jgi:hypothetical protein